jgi:hypothetical protein
MSKVMMLVVLMGWSRAACSGPKDGPQNRVSYGEKQLRATRTTSSTEVYQQTTLSYRFCVRRRPH